MPKSYTSPILYNDLKKISITKLKEWNYLIPGQIKSGSIIWSSNGQKSASISIIVNMISHVCYVELNYSVDQIPINYQVALVSIISNLGKGRVWYFVCPITGKRCRKLYLVGSYFYHRTAFHGCMYEKQTYSKNDRQMQAAYDYILNTDKPQDLANKKHAKTHYRGEFTKKYLKAENRIQKGLQLIDLEKFFRNI